MDYYTGVFKKFTDFGGRARRAEYWYFVLFNAIATLIIGFIDGILGLKIYDNGLYSYGLLTAIYGLIILVPAIALSVRRLHDTDRSGWWLLIAFIPFVGAIVLLVFALQSGTAGTNKYGANPKGDGASVKTEVVVENPKPITSSEPVAEAPTVATSEEPKSEIPTNTQ